MNTALTPFGLFDIPSLLRARAAARPDHSFLIWEPGEGPATRWSYAAFATQVSRVATGLAQRGVTQGDRVLLHMDNCPEALLAWHACAWLGATAVTTNTRSAEDELAYFASHAEVIGAVTQPAYEAIVAALPHLKFIVIAGVDDASLPAWSSRAEPFSALCENEPAPSRMPDPALDLSIQYTSGTTARPKGVVWTHLNGLWGASRSALHEGLTDDDVQLCVLPLFHTNAQVYSGLATLWAGAAMVLQPRFSASRFWPVSVRHGCTFVSLVPFCIKALMERGPPPPNRYRFWAGGWASPPTDEHFGIPTIGWWGMTETITHGIVSDPGLPVTPESIGRPAVGYEIAIRDSDGQPVVPGETGHLLVRGIPGYTLFSRYANDAEATARAYDAEGYFITGDRVTLLSDGCIAFADRDKDMLKVGGENVAASEIERVVAGVEGISEVAVVGKPDPMRDEVPVAFVILASGADEDRVVAEVRRACLHSLADFKRPVEYRVVTDLPRVTLNKVAKAQLRAALRARHGDATPSAKT